ncbi:MAG: hypothetical protein IVW57_07995 [Ktedonobacterales bacterium]|nr:hypothetical protein [Ktedonobacterales bacterium]
MRWFGRGRREGRERVHSRPRVASAASAARAAQTAPEGYKAEYGGQWESSAAVGMGGAHSGGLGSATAGVAAYLMPGVGGGSLVARADASTFPPALMRAALQAARAAGRAPEEIWSEALHDWLLTRETETGGGLPALFQAPRRQHVWSEIEATVRALRAS